MLGIPSVTAATNAFNSQSGRFMNGKFFDPEFALDPKNAAVLNKATAANELANIRQLYCSRYKWTCDDENIPVNYIESMLFLNGMLAFFNDADYGWMLLPCAVKKLNVYGEPSQVTVMFPFNDKANKVLEYGEFYLLRDNPANNIPYYTVQYYTRLIADTARSCEVYSKAMKKPVIIGGNFKTEKTRKEFIRNIYNNEEYVVVNEALLDDLGKLTITHNSSHNANDLKGLAMYKQDLYNECVSKLGITTPTVIKQAQVNKDEINKNDTMAHIILQGTLECRQEASAKIFEMAGINLKCELVPNLNEEITPLPKEEE